jgi:hypothetical protein
VIDRIVYQEDGVVYVIDTIINNNKIITKRKNKKRKV